MATDSSTTSVTVSVGGKAVTLSSDAVYAVSRGAARVHIDDSALDKLASSTNFKTAPLPSVSSPARCLPVEESRAALLVVLSKLVNADSRGVRSTIPLMLVEVLNDKHPVESLDFGSGSGLLSSLYGLCAKESGVATAEEVFVIEESCAPSVGICGIMDCLSSALSVVMDAVAALSCEASKADVGVFDSYVSGDGFSDKGRTGVSGDMKMLMFGSKLTGKEESRFCTDIPTVHGGVRKTVRMLHDQCRIELNSVFKTRKTSISANNGIENDLAGLALHLAKAISFACETSLGRIKLNINLIPDIELKSKLLCEIQNMFAKFTLPKDRAISTVNVSDLNGLFDSLIDGFRLFSINDAFHSACDLLINLQKVLAWEAAVALFVLEMDDSIDKPQSNCLTSSEMKGESVKTDKKAEKKKKKSLGKGTSIIRQLLRDQLGIKHEKLDAAVLAHWVQELISYFDPKSLGVSVLINKVKEIVQSNEVRRLPKIPKGTRDFGKDQMAIRERIFSIIIGIFKRHGAVGLDTPVFELRETLMGKYGEDSKLIYDLDDQGGEICSLRYDLTVPFARYLAMNSITSLKRYHIGKVYRRDNPSKGRYREFYQCDFDIAGQYGAMEADFEVLFILTELLDELEIGDYEIKLNHRKLLDGMFEICGVPSEKFRTVCSSIDKLDKQSFEQVKKELVDDKGLTIEVVEKIGSFVKKRGSAFHILTDLTANESLFSQHNESILVLKDFKILFEALEKAKVLDKIVFDLSLARGLDYYTGVIFEAVMKGSAQVGSIAAGGRYDNLVGMFSGKQVPAVGISLGIERIFTIMEGLNQSGNKGIRSTETQVLVAVLGQDLTVAAELVAEMWNVKIPAEYGVHKKVMKHIERAVAGGIPWMIIIGDLERAQGIVKLKDIKANKEDVVRRDEVVTELQRRLASQPSCQRYAIA